MWPDKDKKAFAADLKTIYHAPDEKRGYDHMMAVTEKWSQKYPSAMARWADNWDVILCPGQDGDLYHQRHREPEQRLPPPKPLQERISEQQRAFKGALSGDF